MEEICNTFVNARTLGVSQILCVGVARFDGQMQKSKPHGFGKMHFLNEGVFTGHFEKGKRKKGKMVYFAQSSKGPCQYQGEWMDGMWHGDSGSFKTESMSYSGDFACGKFEGTGQLKISDAADAGDEKFVPYESLTGKFLANEFIRGQLFASARILLPRIHIFF